MIPVETAGRTLQAPKEMAQSCRYFRRRFVLSSTPDAAKTFVQPVARQPLAALFLHKRRDCSTRSAETFVHAVQVIG
ncbi:hypothetical protein ACP0HM_12850 [Escherichia coli]